MKIMVTGADGYIANGVIRRLLADGNEVYAIGLAATDIADPNYTEHVGNIFDFDFASCDFKPDVLLHLAWRDGFRHNSDAHLEDLPKHYVFIRNALDSGIHRIAVMGTMHEVGYHEGAVDELTVCNPTTPYGVAKNALRQLVGELCRQHGAILQWMRGFYLVSNDGRGASIFAKIVEAERAGKKKFPFTSGKPKYDFLPYEEFCADVAAVVEQDGVDGIINICSGEPVALGEYIENFIKDNGFSLELAYGEYPDRPYDSPAIWGDPSKLRKILEMRKTHA